MSKTNLKSCKVVIVALFSFAVLFADGVVPGQNPVQGTFGINAMVSGQGTLVEVLCDLYYADQTPNDLKTAKKGNPIFHLVLPALDIPPTKTDKPYTVTVAHVDAYWDQVYKESDGWDKDGRTATTSYNCHGHSSGRKRWMAIQPLLNDDYDERTTAEWIRVGAIYGDNGHTGKIASTLVQNLSGYVYEYAIFQISEKWGASAVYERKIEPPIYYTAGEVIPIVGSPFFDVASPFHIPKP